MSNIIVNEDIIDNEGAAQDLLFWNQWSPGLDNDDMTMQEVMDTLPSAPPSAIPWQVKLLENDDGWYRFTSFPGAISLARHDCVHILLGRGLLPQDEAFVIGYTMGASKHSKDIHYMVFRWMACHFYPKPYKFKKHHLIAFDLGYARGKRSDAEDLEYFPFEKFMDYKIGDLRRRLGFDHHQLRAVYRKEKMMLPDSKASHRLDVDWRGTNQADIRKPVGEPLDKSQAAT